MLSYQLDNVASLKLRYFISIPDNFFYGNVFIISLFSNLIDFQSLGIREVINWRPTNDCVDLSIYIILIGTGYSYEDTKKESTANEWNEVSIGVKVSEDMRKLKKEKIRCWRIKITEQQRTDMRPDVRVRLSICWDICM